MATTPDFNADFWEPLDLLQRARTTEARSAWALFGAALTRAGFPQSFYTFGVPMTSKQPLQGKIARGIYGGGLFVDEVFPELVKRRTCWLTSRWRRTASARSHPSCGRAQT